MAPIGEHRDPRWLAPAPQGEAATAVVAASSPLPPPAQLWWEIAAVACIAVFPFLAGALSMVGPPRAPEQDSASMAWRLLGCLLTVVPLLWIARRGGMSWPELGVVRPRPIDLASAAVLTFLCLGIHRLSWMLYLAGSGERPTPLAPAEGDLAPAALLVAGHLANGFAEEVAMRGYLLPRLRAATGSLTVALLGSSTVFASYHCYQGAYGVVDAALFGLIAGVAFLILRNVWVLALAHALSNLWTIYL